MWATFTFCEGQLLREGWKGKERENECHTLCHQNLIDSVTYSYFMWARYRGTQWKTWVSWEPGSELLIPAKPFWTPSYNAVSLCGFQVAICQVDLNWILSMAAVRSWYSFTQGPSGPLHFSSGTSIFTHCTVWHEVIVPEKVFQSYKKQDEPQ